MGLLMIGRLKIHFCPIGVVLEGHIKVFGGVQKLNQDGGEI